MAIRHVSVERCYKTTPYSFFSRRSHGPAPQWPPCETCNRLESKGLLLEPNYNPSSMCPASMLCPCLSLYK